MIVQAQSGGQITMRKALPALAVLLLAAGSSRAATYDVGVGKAYPTIGSVRWSSLAAR